MLMVCRDTGPGKTPRNNEREAKLKEEALNQITFVNNLVKDTKIIIEKNGDNPFPWNEYIEGLAKEFNTTERRIRRHLRKAGLLR